MSGLGAGGSGRENAGVCMTAQAACDSRPAGAAWPEHLSCTRSVWESRYHRESEGRDVRPVDIRTLDYFCGDKSGQLVTHWWWPCSNPPSPRTSCRRPGTNSTSRRKSCPRSCSQEEARATSLSSRPRHTAPWTMSASIWRPRPLWRGSEGRPPSSVATSTTWTRAAEISTMTSRLQIWGPQTSAAVSSGLPRPPVPHLSMLLGIAEVAARLGQGAREVASTALEMAREITDSMLPTVPFSIYNLQCNFQTWNG